MKEGEKNKLIKIAKKVYKAGTRNEQWGRVVMNEQTKKMVNQINPSNLSVLEISGHYWEGVFQYKAYKKFFYPQFDICNTPTEEKFDLIIAEQVFEHLLWPYKAAKNVYSMLNDCGHFLITTPFLVKVHEYPIDCSRWTEQGLKYFLAECGFPLDSIQTGSWGNRACIKANYNKWVNYRKYFHSLKNEPGFPFVVWALAGK